MQGFRVPKGKAARYRKTFQIPADWKGRCIRLRFDAVHSVCTVYVNGKEIGSHVGGFVPFELDATGSVQPGRQNVMEVKVQSESDSDEVSCLSSYASHQVGGLVRKVTLFALPAVHIASENTRTTLDSSCKDARLHYTADIVNTADAPRNVLLTVTLKDKNGNTAATETKNIRLSAGETVPAECVLNVPNARLWTAETPYLYTLSCALASEGKELVSHSLKTGLRQVEIRGNRMMINGHPVKLMGICRHEVHPLTGRSISPELCRKDAELYKNANVALVRTSHYPPSEEFLAACDELGLFVEAESAFCWVGMYSNFWASESYINPAFFPLLLQGNLDHMAAYRNHPSIIFWSMANESAWSHLWKKVMAVMKRHEKSRPIAFHDNYRPGTDKPGNQPDLANYHYPSETIPTPGAGKHAPSGSGNTPTSNVTTVWSWQLTPLFRRIGAAPCRGWRISCGNSPDAWAAPSGAVLTMFSTCRTAICAAMVTGGPLTAGGVPSRNTTACAWLTARSDSWRFGPRPELLWNWTSRTARTS